MGNMHCKNTNITTLSKALTGLLKQVQPKYFDNSPHLQARDIFIN